MNWLRGDLYRVAGARPTGGEGMVPRTKPLARLPEKEVVSYALLHDLAPDLPECPYAHHALRSGDPRPGPPGRVPGPRDHGPHRRGPGRARGPAPRAPAAGRLLDLPRLRRARPRRVLPGLRAPRARPGEALNRRLAKTLHNPTGDSSVTTLHPDVTLLAHNYVRPEVQDAADFVGDSLELARLATRTETPYLVVAGVDFMAETAAILNPDRTVLHPEPCASCAMALRLAPNDVLAALADHPGRGRRGLRQLVGRGQGRRGRLLHLGERGPGRERAGRGRGDLRARPEPRGLRRGPDGEDGLPGPGDRLLPGPPGPDRGRGPGGPGRAPRRRGDGPPRDDARRPGRGRLHRLDLGHDPARRARRRPRP